MWRNPDWVEFDKGSMTDEEVLKLFISSAPNYEAEIRLIFSKLGECPRHKASTVPLINKLHSKGYKVYYLSNYFEYLMHVFPLNFLSYLDGGVFSCYEHVVKPDKRIYEILCERYGLDATECVFIDDSEKNVKAAEAVGMKGIWYNGESMDELIVYAGARTALTRTFDRTLPDSEPHSAGVEPHLSGSLPERTSYRPAHMDLLFVFADDLPRLFVDILFRPLMFIIRFF